MDRTDLEPGHRLHQTHGRLQALLRRGDGAPPPGDGRARLRAGLCGEPARGWPGATPPPRQVDHAVSLGGDADTLACIAGAVAEAFYGVPEAIRTETQVPLPPDLRAVTEAFERAYPLSPRKSDQSR